MSKTESSLEREPTNDQLDRDHFHAVEILLTSVISVQINLPLHLFREGWGVTPGVWGLWDEGDQAWTYKPWARWLVDRQRKVHPLLVPTQNTQMGTHRLIVRGVYNSVESQNQTSSRASTGPC